MQWLYSYNELGLDPNRVRFARNDKACSQLIQGNCAWISYKLRDKLLPSASNGGWVVGPALLRLPWFFLDGGQQYVGRALCLKMAPRVSFDFDGPFTPEFFGAIGIDRIFSGLSNRAEEIPFTQ